MSQQEIWDILSDVLDQHDGACLDDEYDKYFLLLDLFCRLTKRTTKSPLPKGNEGNLGSGLAKPL
jgi:hypothetical protein